ncbi:hypothetical protein NEOC65_001915 [Neochlamydia sp. AcF65]|uniref:tetratricopeptide repeat protein n=1 Tax=Neochlamydia sp. AcF65 TaxID=2795735 RepID=UPI001BC936A2|nr:tetratricopeptide repeat protein [Neochlamydia sp. AcF65]MBS4166818.1 hypothetical protein [Neochlamydia sp. AcF65]
MSVSNSGTKPCIFPEFQRIQNDPSYSLGDTDAFIEISLKIFKKLTLQDLCQAQLVCRQWKQLIGQTDEASNFHLESSRVSLPKEKLPTCDKENRLDTFPFLWDSQQIAASLWDDSSTIINEAMRAKVNTAADYLNKEGFELKGVPSDGDCFFSAFLASYKQLSRKIPLLDEHKDKIFYLRQVLADIIKHTDRKRAEEIIEKGTWVSGLGEGDLLAPALSIPIRLVTVNEEHLICGIHDRLIFSDASSPEDSRSSEWETIPQEERPTEYILIVDLGGHFIHAQKSLRQNPFSLLKTEASYESIDYFDEIANYIEKTVYLIDQSSNALTKEQLEKAEEIFTLALKLAVRKNDRIREAICMERLGDVYVGKGTHETLLQGAGLYNQALRLAPQERHKLLRDKISKVHDLFVRICESTPLNPAALEKQFETNLHTLKNLKEETQCKLQVLSENPSMEQARELQGEISQQIKFNLGHLAIQLLHHLQSKPCKTSIKTQQANNFAEQETLKPPSYLVTLPLKVFQQIFLSFSSLKNDELKRVLNAKSCARIFRQHLPSKVQLLNQYQPQKLLSYLDKIADHLEKMVYSIDQISNALTKQQLKEAEEAYTLALKLAIQKKDSIQQALYIEKLGDVYVGKGTHETLLQAAGLYRYALRLAPQKRHEILRRRLFRIHELLIRLCNGKTLHSAAMKRQFAANDQAVKNLRDEIEDSIQALPNNPPFESIRELYSKIALRIKVFFGHLVMQALNHIGDEPCEYAMIGFGSLAREEMTPYSDLEFGILIAEDTPLNRKYFQNLTSLIHLKVINLGETILPALNIPCLNAINFFDDITPRGLAFDGAGVKGKGCKTPFGNRETFELIQTPEKMAEYIAQAEEGKWWHEKEPHLPMELLTFTHLLGNPKLTDQYSQKIQEKLSVSYREGFNLRQHLAKQHLIVADMENFNPAMDDLDKQGMLFKVKNDFYRFPHLALDRIALIKKVNASDTFTRIDQLEKQSTLKGNAAEKLKEWMSIALFMRLKTYAHYKKQNEMMNPLTRPFRFDDSALIKKQFALEPEALKKVREIYQVFIPFYKAFKAFLLSNEDDFEFSNLDDGSPETRGDIARRLFQFEEAENLYFLAKKNNPQNSNAFSALGLIYKSQGKLELAAEYTQEALEIDLKLFGENHPHVVRNYNNLGLIYQEQGILDKAVDYIEKALTIGSKLFGENHRLVAVFYNNLAICYRTQGILKKSIEYTKRALLINTKIFGENHISVALLYSNLGTLYQAQGFLDRAEEKVQKALKIILEIFGQNHSIVASTYNNLGLIYKDQDILNQAAEYIDKALEIDLKLFGENCPSIARYHNNLGQICLDQGELENAVEYTKKGLIINHKLFGENSPQVANDYANLGLIYQHQGNLKESAEHAEKALAIRLNLFGENHTSVSLLYNNLGLIYQDQGYFGWATDYIKKALAIDLKLFGEKNPQVACLYNNLGQIHKKQGNFEKAIKYINLALNIELKLFGKTHSNVASRYNNLGMIYKEQGNLEKASELITEALIINFKLFGENHPSIAITYNNLGQISQAQGNLDEAVGHTLKALAIDRKRFGEVHFTVARDYNNLGTIYKEQGKLDKALGYVHKALDIDREIFGENHPDVLRDYNNLGLIYQDQGNLKEAIKYSKQTLRMALRLFDNANPQVAIFYNNMATVYLKLGKFNKAADYSKKALATNLALFGENHPSVAIIYNNLGAIYQKQGDLEQAVELTKKALDIDRKIFGEIHPNMLRAFNNLGQIFKMQGKLDIAAEYIKKAIAIEFELFGENRPTMAGLYNNLGTLYQEQGNLKQAIKYSKKALVIERKLLGEIHFDVSRDYKDLANLYKNQGKLNKAIEHTEKALAIDLNLFGESSHTVANLYSNLAQLYTLQGNQKRMIECSFKASELLTKILGENHPAAVMLNNTCKTLLLLLGSNAQS